jgi:hypothetical protein
MYRPYVQMAGDSNLTLNLGLCPSFRLSRKRRTAANFNFYSTCTGRIATNSFPASTLMGVWALSSIKQLWNLASVLPGRCWKAKHRLRVRYLSRFFVEPGGQGLWEARRFSLNRDSSHSPLVCGAPASLEPLLESGFPPCAIRLIPLVTTPQPDNFAGTVLSQNLDFKQGMMQQFNLNVEQQLPWMWCHGWLCGF